MNDKKTKNFVLEEENPLTGIREYHTLLNAQEIRPAKADAAGPRRAAVSGYR